MKAGINPINTMKGTRPCKHGIRQTPGMPHWSEESNAKRPRVKVTAAAPEPKIIEAKVSVVPHHQDTRYSVEQLPAGYVSGLDPAQCRGWAKAVAR